MSTVFHAFILILFLVPRIYGDPTPVAPTESATQASVPTSINKSSTGSTVLTTTSPQTGNGSAFQTQAAPSSPQGQSPVPSTASGTGETSKSGDTSVADGNNNSTTNKTDISTTKPVTSNITPAPTTSSPSTTSSSTTPTPSTVNPSATNSSKTLAPTAANPSTTSSNDMCQEHGEWDLQLPIAHGETMVQTLLMTREFLSTVDKNIFHSKGPNSTHAVSCGLLSLFAYCDLYDNHNARKIALAIMRCHKYLCYCKC
ncbi:hypothetical protein KP79_PYT06194 [Mizuhopecten yessoensis]|uniref:Uncharacterized protein n=1 Tax=Mizuhopecten yessoensis TaxID=6573 RepID=A0A210QGD8_MIZYE|nr:hypothetical protein KP79_PYT06194 [Mizuhopecten yessoensis]